MGFRSGTAGQDDPAAVAAMRMMTDMFGGAPYSRLFTVVREQMNLCYYCAARYAPSKGIVCVDSGIEVENFEKARDGILAQLAVMKEGSYDDTLLESSKKGLSDFAAGVNDSAGALESWYLQRIFHISPESPEEFAQQVQALHKQDIVQAAQSVVLDTIYLLKGMGGETDG